MKKALRVLAFAGSARKQSVNKQLISEAARVMGKLDTEVTVIDLADFEAPIYNGDYEDSNGIPETMRELKTLMNSHDAFIVATPEYNGGITPLLLNVLSWASRAEGDEAPKAVFTNKPVMILAASPGQLGGIRAASRLRDSLADLGCMPIPGFATVANAYDAFDEQGYLQSKRALEQLSDLAKHLIKVASA